MSAPPTKIKSKDSKEPAHKKEHIPDESPSADDGFWKRREGKKKKNKGKPFVPKFKGAIAALEGHIYDVGLPSTSQDLFSKTTKAIGEYVSCEFDNAGEFRLGMEQLKLPNLVEPPDPGKDPTHKELELFKIKLKDYEYDTWKRKLAMQRIFPVVLGQCSDEIRDRVEASPSWARVNGDNDVFELLQLIRKAMHQRATSRYETHTYIDAKNALATF